MGLGGSISRLIALAAATCLVAAGCGGDDDRERRSGGGSGSGGQEFSASDVKVEAAELIYQPDQIGGNFHDAYVVIKNTTNEPAVVNAQLSYFDAKNKLIQTANPNPATVPPRGEGAFTETAIDLPKPTPDGYVEATLDPQFGAGQPTPIQVSQTRAAGNGFGGCKLTGTISNGLSGQASDLEIRAVGLSGVPTTGGFTYVDKVFPKQDATFEVDSSSPCDGADEVAAFPTSIDLATPIYPSGR